MIVESVARHLLVLEQSSVTAPPLGKLCDTWLTMLPGAEPNDARTKTRLWSLSLPAARMHCASAALPGSSRLLEGDRSVMTVFATITYSPGPRLAVITRTVSPELVSGPKVRRNS